MKPYFVNTHTMMHSVLFNQELFATLFNIPVCCVLIPESGLSVEMTNTVNVNEGDKLELSCKVSGYTGQLSVTWQHKSTSPDAPFTGVISLSQEGVMEKSEVAQDVKVKALRPAPDLFTMEIDNATQSDSGVYQCTVSEWKTNSKASSRLGTANVTVTSLGIVCLFGGVLP